MEARELTRKDIGENKRNFFAALDKVAEHRSKLVGVLTDLVTALEERDTKDKPLSSQELELLTNARKIIAQLQ